MTVSKIPNTAWQINNLSGQLAIVANGNTHAAIAAGQYVYVRGHADLAEGLYTAAEAIAQNGALSTANLSAVSGGGLNALNNSLQGTDVSSYFTASTVYYARRFGHFVIASFAVMLSELTMNGTQGTKPLIKAGMRPRGITACSMRPGSARFSTDNGAYIDSNGLFAVLIPTEAQEEDYSLFCSIAYAL